MQPVAACFGLTQRIEQYGIMIKLSLVDVFVDQSQILKNDSPGTENHVADFRIAHLPRRQTDIDAGHGQACELGYSRSNASRLGLVALAMAL